MSLADRVGCMWKMRVHKLATPLGFLRIKLEHQLRKMWRLIDRLESTLFFRQDDSICLLVWFSISTCLIALNDHLIVCSLQHDSLSHMLDRTLFVWYLSTCHMTTLAPIWLYDSFSLFTISLYFLGFSDAPTSFTVHFRLSLSVERWESLHH